MKVANPVFRYSCHVKFLNDCLHERSGKLSSQSRALSDKYLAKTLGYRSSRSIGMVLEGKRLPSSEMLLQISNHLNLDDSEKLYLDLLVQRERLVRKKKSVDLVESEMKRLNASTKDKKILEDAYFSYVAEWYHFALKQLVASPSFRGDLNWIQRRLKNKISIEEIKSAFQNLKLLGLVREKAGKLIVSTPTVTTNHDVPSEKIRQHHKQMMARASEALEEESVENREFFSLTFRVNRKNMPSLKKQIRRFKDSIESQFEAEESDDVFQMNLQLFPHTTKLQIGKEK